YMGVSPAILMRHFLNVDLADKFLASIVLHAFSPTDDGSMSIIPPTNAILRAVSDRAPLHNSFEYNSSAARFFLGPQRADYLGVKHTSWMMWIKFRALLVVQGYPMRFGRIYARIGRPGWMQKRREALAAGMVRVLRFQMGMRRTAFRPAVREYELEEKVKKE